MQDFWVSANHFWNYSSYTIKLSKRLSHLSSIFFLIALTDDHINESIP